MQAKVSLIDLYQLFYSTLRDNKGPSLGAYTRSIRQTETTTTLKLSIQAKGAMSQGAKNEFGISYKKEVMEN
ncbi:hypothetical protein HUJ04_009389 [Dendroctonus ponderosae]|nr:hypothetical protein HUJ04_009389 [Dendroctonus ponderosae]